MRQGKTLWKRERARDRNRPSKKVQSRFKLKTFFKRKPATKQTKKKKKEKKTE